MVVSHLRQGKNVRLDGLGTFSLALSSREVTDRKEIRACLLYTSDLKKSNLWGTHKYY